MSTVKTQSMSIDSRDGFRLAATLYGQATGKLAIMNSAMGVPQRFYRHYASWLASRGWQTITWDYRGIGGSLRQPLAQCEATILDWAELDLPGILSWGSQHLEPTQTVLLGHSVGGQIAGMLEDPSSISAMVGFSAQSGYWRLQGGEQKLIVALHGYLTIPLLTKVYGYAPLSKVGAGEDLPRNVGLGWAKWLRHPKYLFGDETLPLMRYKNFSAPILGYSFSDDKWGTKRSVDALMAEYPNVERRHVKPSDFGLNKIGHVDYFRPQSEALWEDTASWLDFQLSL